MSEEIKPGDRTAAWIDHMPRVNLEGVSSLPVYDAGDPDICGTTIIGRDGCTYVFRSDTEELCGPIDTDEGYDWRVNLDHPGGMGYALQEWGGWGEEKTWLAIVERWALRETDGDDKLTLAKALAAVLR